MPRLTDLTAATTPLDGTEVLYVVQGGNSRRTVTQEVADLFDLPDFSSQAQAEAGTANDVLMTPLATRQAFNATGAAPVYACRAWVNFNGTGTPAIRASGNVSSITDNGTGDYTVNFTTAMTDANYAWSLSGQRDGTALGGTVLAVPEGSTGTPTTTALRIATYNSATAAADFPKVCVAIFR